MICFDYRVCNFFLLFCCCVGKSLIYNIMVLTNAYQCQNVMFVSSIPTQSIYTPYTVIPTTHILQHIVYRTLHHKYIHSRIRWNFQQQHLNSFLRVLKYWKSRVPQAMANKTFQSSPHYFDHNHQPISPHYILYITHRFIFLRDHNDHRLGYVTTQPHPVLCVTCHAVHFHLCHTNIIPSFLWLHLSHNYCNFVSIFTLFEPRHETTRHDTRRHDTQGIRILFCLSRYTIPHDVKPDATIPSKHVLFSLNCR